MLERFEKEKVDSVQGKTLPRARESGEVAAMRERVHKVKRILRAVVKYESPFLGPKYATPVQCVPKLRAQVQECDINVVLFPVYIAWFVFPWQMFEYSWKVSIQLCS